MKLRGALPGAAVALVLLTGCSQLAPGTAAEVNGTRITDDEVSALADAQCLAARTAAKQGQQVTTLAESRLKQQSLGLLMDTELSLQYAADQKITPTPSLVTGFYQQLEPGIDPLPSSARTELSEVFHRWAEGRAALVEAGSKATGKATSFTNVNELLTAGLKARDSWLKGAKIQTDPRYGPAKNGFPGGSDSSVSRATSSFAKDATAAQSSPTFVSGLPASQKCG